MTFVRTNKEFHSGLHFCIQKKKVFTISFICLLSIIHTYRQNVRKGAESLKKLYKL